MTKKRSIQRPDEFKFIRKRLKNLGIRYPDAYVIAKWFQKNLEARGREGAIDIFKRVGDTLIWSLTGSGKPAKWISIHNGFPRALSVIRHYPKSTLFRIAKFARTVVLPGITKSQVDKVYNAIVTPRSPQTDNSVEDMTRLVLDGCVSLTGVSGRFGKPSTVCTQFRRVVSYSGVTPVQSEPPILESLYHLAHKPWLMNVPWWRNCLKPLRKSTIDEAIDKLRQLPAFEYMGSPESVGLYGYSQEGGGKLRAFASPFTIVQCILDPIRDWITDFLKVVQTDCTWDQLSGAVWAQDLLKQGVTVHSVDLSTATCRFPLEPQLKMLEFLGMPMFALDTLSRVCRGEWLIHEDFKPFNVPDVLQWSVGQPLGISPSIRMFSLAHNMLLVGICRELGRKPTNTFRILGDDVLISDAAVAARYRAVLSGAGVPISEHKSHASNAFAEFAGFSITPDEMVRPGQWRKATPVNMVELSLDLNVPLKGEVTQSEQFMQKLMLFRKGEFNPPVEQYTHYLCAATMYEQVEDFLEFIPRQHVVPVDQGLRPIVVEQLAQIGVHGQITSLGHSIDDIFAMIPRHQSNVHAWSILAFGDNISWSQCAFNAWMAVNDLPETSLKDKMDLWKSVHDRLLSFLWLPPVSRSKETRSSYMRIARSLARADAVLTSFNVVDSDWKQALLFLRDEGYLDDETFSTEWALASASLIGIPVEELLANAVF